MHLQNNFFYFKEDDLKKRQMAAGWNIEDLELILDPMSLEKNEAVGSMGDDTPLACFSKKHRNFIEKKELGITLLSDESTEMMQEYGVWQLKKNYGKEYMGIVRTAYIINPDGIIKAVFAKVRVKEHVAKVQAELERLQA